MPTDPMRLLPARFLFSVLLVLSASPACAEDVRRIETISTSKYLNVLDRRPDGSWTTTHDIWNASGSGTSQK